MYPESRSSHDVFLVEPVVFCFLEYYNIIMKTAVRIKEYKDGNNTERMDVVVVEKNMEMILNEKTKISLAISPQDLEAFTYGFLYTSGFITTPSEVERLLIDEEKEVVEVKLIKEKSFDYILSLGSSAGRYLESTTPRKDSPDSETAFSTSSNNSLPGPDQLFSLFEEFAKKSVVFAETGGVHSAAVTDGQKILFFAEDIGRHNAVDKVIGKAFLAKINFSTHFLMLSGRISSEIVKKCLNAGFQTIVSRAAPTNLAIERAEAYHMTLVGFLRGKRFNIYTNL